MAAISAGSAGEVIQALWIPESPGTTSTEFTVSTDHPLVTLVAMIAPTPDWFVGVEGLNLLQGQAWTDSVVVDLFPFDAGTDSGIGYTSPDLATVPPDPVAAITGGPFSPGVSLGTFTFVRRDDVSSVPPLPTAQPAVAPNPFNPRTTVSFHLDADRAHPALGDLSGEPARRRPARNAADLPGQVAPPESTAARRDQYQTAAANCSAV
ncbi:hypothetical protein GW813_11345 [bacterium]|nr:hypothetical protein [bacterium]PIV80911.1 MAG: hypothetical protein COW53_07180 [bacterium CG17_big_fil_post_rev_8_21_14_2_50_64_8]PJA74413.1 MAG: hypothetical protein CO151_09850 [bacterium CG_4_9_14_3_um_filter_65_15]